MKGIEHFKYNHTKGISWHSKRNHFEISFGLTNKVGLMGGFMVHEDFDWWHLDLGQTIGCLFFSIKVRWRVFGAGYDRRDKEDFYI